MKDHYAQAKDAERRKAWDEAAYHAIMASAGAEATKLSDGEHVIHQPITNTAGAIRYMKARFGMPAKRTSETRVSSTGSWTLVHLYDRKYVLAVEDGEAIFYETADDA